MRKFGILNRKLNDALASLGHGDVLLVTDAGFPLPYEAQPGTISVDLAIAQDLPDIPTVLKLINDEMIFEECYVALNQAEYNPDLFNEINKIVKRCKIDIVENEKLMALGKRAKVLVRTGAFSPWGNIALVSGVNAPVWFSKPGVKVPEFYIERVQYCDEDYPQK